MAEPNIVPVDAANRALADAFLRERWLSTDMVTGGRVLDLTRAEGFMLLEGGRVAALATYVVEGADCELTSLDSLCEGRGIGSRLIRLVENAARGRGCKRLTAVTTNDNIEAIRFYQRRGFDLCALRRNALEASRRLKPAIPLVGEHGIPLRHELVFERDLTEK